MSLSPVVRAADFQKSIKKYFISNLETIENITLFFKPIFDVPISSGGDKLTSWIMISFGDKDYGPVTEQVILLDLFTREDDERDYLSSLTDKVLGYIIDENSNNGLVTIPYYDVSGSTWVNVGGIIPFIEPLQQSFEGKDETKIQTITLRCKWGGK